MEDKRPTVLRSLWIILFAASIPIAIAGVTKGREGDWMLFLGFGMGVVALFIRRFTQKP